MSNWITRLLGRERQSQEHGRGTAVKRDAPTLFPPLPFQASHATYILGLRDSSGVHTPINDLIGMCNRNGTRPVAWAIRACGRHKSVSLLHLVDGSDSPGTLLPFGFRPEGHYDSVDDISAVSLEWFFIERLSGGYVTHAYALGNNGAFTGQILRNMDTEEAQPFEAAFPGPIESWFINSDWTYR